MTIKTPLVHFGKATGDDVNLQPLEFNLWRRPQCQNLPSYLSFSVCHTTIAARCRIMPLWVYYINRIRSRNGRTLVRAALKCSHRRRRSFIVVTKKNKRHEHKLAPQLPNSSCLPIPSVPLVQADGFLRDFRLVRLKRLPSEVRAIPPFVEFHSVDISDFWRR